MGIRKTYGAAAVAKAGEAAGQARAEQAKAERRERQQRLTAQRTAQKEAQQYQTSVRNMQMALDLEAEERARRWEIDKMELRSQMDFQREEKVRQRKLDGFDNVDAQLDKEVQAGRLSEKEIETYRLKNNLARQGMNVSLSELRQQQGDERFGMPPYWEEYFKEEYTGTEEREFAEAKRQEVISGRTGTRPWFLDPEVISTELGKQAQLAAGIFLEEEDIQEIIKAPSANITDVEQITIISPDGVEGTIPIGDLEEALAAGYTQTSEEPVEQIEAEVLAQTPTDTVRKRMEKVKKGRTLSPLGLLMELVRARKFKEEYTSEGRFDYLKRRFSNE